jgi:hypothetical protein
MKEGKLFLTDTVIDNLKMTSSFFLPFFKIAGSSSPLPLLPRQTR